MNSEMYRKITSVICFIGLGDKSGHRCFLVFKSNPLSIHPPAQFSRKPRTSFLMPLSSARTPGPCNCKESPRPCEVGREG